MSLVRELETVAIGRLKPNPRNSRKHGKKQLTQIARSIREFDFTAPVLTDEDYVILAGHGRLEAAKEAGLIEIPCIKLTGLSPAQKRAYLIADNKLALNANWDVEMLAQEFGELAELGFEVDLTGFEFPEVDALMSQAKESSVQPQGPEDEIPEAPNAGRVVSSLGDRWKMGRHALLNGDAKDILAIERLMVNEPADMCFTDHPYNVPMNGHARGLGKTQHREFVEASGEMSRAQYVEFLKITCSNIAHACRDGAIVYTCIDWRHLAEMIEAGEYAFDTFKNDCVWVKTNAGMGSFYRSQHEHVLVWKVGTAPHTNNFGLGNKGRHRTNVWAYAGVTSFKAGREEELALHPTVKPVALVADAIRDVSNRGQIVLDPFGGSGTTLIGAEQTGRVARLLELDPGYCDVIIRRWQQLTGKNAILDETGETFEEVEIRRLAQPATAWGRVAA